MPMNKKSFKFIRNTLYKAVLFLVTISVLLSCFAYAKAPRTVKVAFFPMEGYHILDANGNFSGMDVEYLNALCEYTGWNIEYVICESWDDALLKLATHDVDLVGSAQYSQQRAEIYDYADLSSGYTYGMLASNGDSSIAYEDFDVLQNATFGVVSTYVRKPEFFQYLADHGISSPKVREYNDTHALQAALDAGEIDVMVHTFMEIKEGQRLLGRFAPKPIYYITWRGNTDLLRELNNGIADLAISQPELEIELLNKYYESKLDKTVLFTTEEKEYIAKKQVLNVGFLADQYPFSYRDEESGLFAGLSRNLLESALADTGLQLNYVEYQTHADAHAGLAANEIDLQVYCVSPESELNSAFKALEEYARIPLVLVCNQKKSFDDIKTLSTLSDFFGFAEQILDLESVSLIAADTPRACLDLLESGAVDAALCDAYLAEDLLRTVLQYQDLHIINVLNIEHCLHMVIRQDEDPCLERILSKSVTPINAKDINEYTLATNIYPLLSLNTFLRDNSLAIMFALVVVIILIVAVSIRFARNSKKIQRLMYKDPSMDVWNINYLYYMGAQKVADHRENYVTVCLNISKLRRYNVIYGWKAGQKLLEITKDTLEKCVDDSKEICARNYADRFVILLSWTDWDALMERLQNIQQLIEALIYTKTETRMRIQMGVCDVAAKSKNLHSAVACANQALESIANDNSNQSEIKVYDTSFEASIKERHEREKLLEAVDISQHFVTYYQNKVDIRTDNIVGAEALVRFKDPTANGAIKSPAFFVPYYEQTGRITEVDFFVLESVCQMLRNRLDEGKDVVPISCNFSRMNFVKPGFPARFESILAKYQISKDLVEIEVTETLIVEDFQQYNAKGILSELKERGIHLSIDDFGSGYSSLGTFELVPASVVKLDRSFLLNCDDRDRQIKIMRNIVRMSEDLGFQIVCEGVESKVDVDLMHEVHAYIAQGYFYSNPAPQQEFERLLDAN